MELEFDLNDDEPLTAVDSALIVMAFDRANRVIDLDGHMHVETSNISKANVCPYLGSEIPNAAELRLDPAKIYHLYRDPTELQASAKSYDGKPLMMRHVVVSADAPQKFMQVGAVYNARWKPPYLVASLSIWDGEAIKNVQSREQEQISCGYRYTADMTPGIVDGVRYDGIMRNIVANHVALVNTGRAGPDVLVSDELPQGFAIMKKSALIAALAPFLAVGADQVALDAAIVALAADKKAKDKDCDDPEMNDKAAAQDKAAKDKAAKDEEALKATAAKDKAAKDKAAKDEEDDDIGGLDDLPDGPKGGANKPAMTNIKGSADKKGMDSASVASVVEAALVERDALHAARSEVESILGKVTYDTAAEVYKAALVKLEIGVDGIDPSAFPALLKIAKDARAARAAPSLATDSATIQSMSKAFPGLDRFK